MKHLFVMNPVAGRGKPLKLIPEIEKFCSRYDYEWNIEVSRYPGQAIDIVRRYATDIPQDHELRIYSVGGDGTVNEIVNGIMQSGNSQHCSLAIIPSGSGNDFFKSIPHCTSFKELLYCSVSGGTEPIDLAAVNGRYFANIASLGFDAEVVLQAQQIKKYSWIPANLSYFAGIAATVFQYKNLHMVVTIDSKRIDGKFLLLAIANGKYYGGGILPAPEARYNDGLLDVCLIHEKGFLEIVTTMHKYIYGKHRGLPGVSFYKAREVKVTCERETALNIDGEIIAGQEAQFKIVPAGINLVIPLLKDNMNRSQDQAAASNFK